jgi:tRNA A37 threonylcarbamoyladenosine dehydratase
MSSQLDQRSVACVAIIGTGFVGSTTANALLITGTAPEVVLIDRDRNWLRAMRRICGMLRCSRILRGF